MHSNDSHLAPPCMRRIIVSALRYAYSKSLASMRSNKAVPLHDALNIQQWLGVRFLVVLIDCEKDYNTETQFCQEKFTIQRRLGDLF